LLQTESVFAEAAGDVKHALESAREVNGLLSDRHRPGLRSSESSLEARYVARENEVRIRDLVRENTLKDLALKTADAQSAQQIAARHLQELGTLVAVVIAGLLVFMLRVQKRHAAELREQALRDPLTGVDNRRAFLLDATRLIATPRSARTLPHVLMLIDFDHFKRINDSVGHPMGDVVLGVVVAYLQRASEGVARISRLGGEEFAVLYPNAGAEAGVRLAETLRAGVAALPLPAEVKITHITISIGIALFDGERCHDLDSWMRAADTALYSAKAHGRDRVVASSVVPEVFTV
jgi:diguanylate cyclase (GGDEF)-like protein